MVITALVTGLVSKSLWDGSCGKLNLPKKAEWDLVNRLEIPERGLTVSRLVSDNRCYIMPAGVSQVQGEGRPLMIDDQPLGFTVVEHVAGPDAAAFCQGYKTYMVREFKPEELEDPSVRNRRDSYGAGPPMPGANGAGLPPTAPAAPAAGGAPPPAAPAAGGAPPPAAPAAGGAAPAAGGAAPAPGSTAELAAKVPVLTGQQVVGEGIFGGAQPPTDIVANIPMEKREPRCHKILLDCTTMVGQVQSCFTWQNGRMYMDRKCESETKFVIRMTKPPGRILKVAQQESLLCLQNHKAGKDC